MTMILAFLIGFLFTQLASSSHLKECSVNHDCGFNSTSLRCSKIDQKCSCIRFHDWDPKEGKCLLNLYALKINLAHLDTKDEEKFLRETSPPKIKGYQRDCSHDEHCEDFSLICSQEIQKCVCARFHDLINQKCVLNYSMLKSWLQNLDEEKDTKAKVDEHSVEVFQRLAFSGILALSLGFFGALSCILVFCVLKNHSPPPDEVPKRNDVNGIETVSPVFLDFE